MKRKRILVPAIAVITVLIAIAAVLGWNWYDRNVDRSGWAVQDGTRLYKDFHGDFMTGWQEIDGNRYCFGEDGAMLTGWMELEEDRYYLGQDGVMVTGWQEVDGQNRFFRPDGTLGSGWLDTSEGRCYLDGGVPLTGWQELDGSRFYFDGSGAASVGQMLLDGKTYLFDDSGVMVTGWVDCEEGRWYYQPDGAMSTGWNEIDGQRFYFREDGSMYTGWLQEGEYDYYLQPDGSAAIGPTEIDGQTYFFSPKGIHIWLVNPWNPIHDDYEVTLEVSEGGFRVADICLDALEQMLRDCRAAGCSPHLISGYRTKWDQQALYRDKVAEYGASAKQIVAVPGTSEHQLGLAVDIVSENNRTLNAHQASTAVQMWLMEHCWEYGFILRYPVGTTEITGIIYEPWHYRYVGLEVSLELKELGITLEEYVSAESPGE